MYANNLQFSSNTMTSIDTVKQLQNTKQSKFPEFPHRFLHFKNQGTRHICRKQQKKKQINRNVIEVLNYCNSNNVIAIFTI